MKRLLVSLAALSLFSCSSAPAPEAPKAPAEMPITSKSPEAVDHFKKGRDFYDNQRVVEATQEFNQALKLDPDFALALAYRGGSTFGPEGVTDLEQANAKAASTSKPEQLMIGAILAGRHGELAKGEDLWKQAAEAAPTDWRVHLGRAVHFFVEEKYGEEIDSLNKAIAINPSAGPAYNMLGYAHLLQGESAPAVEALKKYASLAPSEPNPHDSLGEALMADGKFADAEAEFQEALSLSPTFAVAWDGVAYTRFYANNWAGGHEAVAKGREAASRPIDRMAADRLTAFATLAEGKTADGQKLIDALSKSSDASRVDTASTPASRAMVMIETGRYRDAVTEAAKTMAAADQGQLPPGASQNLRRVSLEVTAAAQGRMGDVAGAQKTVAALEKESAARSDDVLLKSTVHLAQGMLAAAQKDMSAARMHFALCSNRDTYCQWQAFEVSQKARDKAGADAALARLTKSYVRDPVSLYARSSATRAMPKQTN